MVSYNDIVSSMHEVVLTVLFAARAVYMVTVVLSPPVVDVIENSNVTLTCRVMNSSDEVHTTGWRENQVDSPVGYINLHQNGTCSALGYINDVSLFAWSCERNSTFTLTLKDVKRNTHKKEWRCSGSYTSSNASQILVRVPVESVQMKSHTKEKISIKENRRTSFECTTTSSRPIPALFWFLTNPEDLEIINLTNEARQSPPAGESINLTAVTSVLNYNFTRRFNGRSLYCEATNMPDQYVTTGKKLLDIMYPPDGFPKLIGSDNGRPYRIVEHQVGKLSCIINGGNPLPTLTWSCFKGNVSELLGNDSVSSTFTWTVLRVQHNKTCVCVSEHVFGKKNVSTIVKVLYPPITPVFKIGETTVGNEITIIQKNTKTVTCMTDSNPESDFTWSGSSVYAERRQTLNVTSVAATYTCMVNNTMVRSDGSIRRGTNSSSITVHTLIPPTPPSFTYIDYSTSESISGHSVDVIKGDQFTIVCHSSGNPNPVYRWEDGISGNSVVIRASIAVNKTCTAKNTMRETVGESRKGSKSAGMSISVHYPPIMRGIYMHRSTGQNVSVTNTLNVLEGETFSLSCDSHGRPTPHYIWYLNDSRTAETDTIKKVNISRHESGIYTCLAFNTMIRTFGKNESGSSKISTTVDILFPPMAPTYTYIDHYNTSKLISRHSIDVIKGDKFTIVCHSFGNPLPVVRWENGIGGNSVVIIASVSVNKTCTVTNTIKETVGESRQGNKSAVLSITVNYSPVMLRMYLHRLTYIYHVTVAKTLKVLEGSTFSLSCEAEGTPTPKYTWYLNNSMVIPLKHKIEKVNISRHESGTYTCCAYNTLIRTFGNNESGSSNISTNIDVLYPADIGFLDDLTVIEGSSINISCPIIPGNPPLTNVKWLPGGDLRDHDSRMLYIENVRRDDEGNYKCSVNSTMKPSYDRAIWKENSKHFKLTTVYKATVMHFFVGEQIEQIATVNELDDVTFQCSFDSKPPPIANISHMGNSIMMSDSNNLTYTKRNMQCYDFGTYICSGMNDLNNGTPSVKSLTIYVNCSPRPSPDVIVIDKVACERNAQATLTFTAVAYPVPGPSGFSWYFVNSSDVVPLENSSRLIISSSNLLSKLTVVHVNESDYGDYLLKITNTINAFEQRFTLERYAAIPRTHDSSDSSNIGEFVGVGVGSVVTTLIVVGIVYFVYRHHRMIRHTHEHKVVYKRSADTTRSFDNEESSVTYESLDRRHNEDSTYSQLSAPGGQVEDVARERSPNMTLYGSKRKRDTPDYINTQI